MRSYDSRRSVFECLPLVTVERMVGSNGFAQKLGELPQLDDGGAGIAAEVTLSKNPQLHETGIVRAQKAEIACRQKLPPCSRARLFIGD